MCYIISMKRTALFIIIAAATSTLLYAESDFEKWKREQQQAYKSYLSEQEKAFSDMLKKEWEEFQSQSGFILDKSPKPVSPPETSLPESPESGSSVEIPENKPAELSRPQTGPDRSQPSAAGKKQSPSEPAAEKRTEHSNLSSPDRFQEKSGNRASGEIPGDGKTAEKVPGGAAASEGGITAGLSRPAEKKGIKYISINFYGTVFSVPFPENFKIKDKTEKVNNKTISDFFEYYSGQELDETAEWFKSLKTDYKMNGWSVLKIAEKTSEKLLSTEKDKTLMIWFLLLKSDYDIKIAYSSNNVYLLYVPDVKVYAAPYITENRKNYYFYNKTSSKQERIRTYSGSFVKNPSIVMMAPENPDHFKSETENREILFRYKNKNYPVSLEYNNSLIKYYREYPQVDISYYFRENISDKAVESYKKSLYPYIRGMNEKDSVQFILTFVQTGFKYKTDDQQFGYEKPMFPDETLHYPYIDCEDRSALFISIVRELTGLDAVALDYPGHIAAAVSFNDNVKGDSFNYKGKKYTVCDPTYINASVGMTMPDYKNVKPVIIETGK